MENVQSYVASGTFLVLALTMGIIVFLTIFTTTNVWLKIYRSYLIIVYGYAADALEVFAKALCSILFGVWSFVDSNRTIDFLEGWLPRDQINPFPFFKSPH